MADIRNFLKLMTAVFVLMMTNPGLSQQAPGESRTTSYLTYFYQLTTDQSEAILKKGIEIVDDSFFNNLAYTFPTDSLNRNPPDLSFGNYLKIYALGNELEVEFLCASNVEIRILNNGADLNLLILDHSGNEIKDATVLLNSRRIKYDNQSNVYRLKKNNAKGVLKVTNDGVTSYLGLDREIEYSKFRRSFNSVAYGVPLKFVTIPVKLVIKSPYDLFMSVKRRYPQGIFYYTSKPFVDIVRSISWGDPQGFVRPLACIFDDYYCKDKDYDGYMAFNKPKFRPGDTVRLKAYVLDHKDRLFDEEIELWIGSSWWFNHKQSKQLMTISPYRPGFYETYFVLHDSLNLDLDKEYQIYIRQKDETLISDSFYYEDYLLDESEFTLRLDKEQVYPEDSLKLFLKGKDANGLNVKDATVEIEVKPGIVHEITTDSLYIDNIVWTKEQALDPNGETTIVIPPGVLYSSDIEYDVVARFQTADFETHTRVKGFRHLLKKPSLEHELFGDSLNLKLAMNDSFIFTKGTIYGLNQVDLVIDTLDTQLPASIQLNPLIKEYRIVAGDHTKVIAIDELNSNVEVFAERSKDSLHVQLANPRKLNVRYFLFKKNKEIARGNGKDWKLDIKTTTKKEYYISIQYVWAGKSYDKNYTIDWSTSELNLVTNAPSIVYPGKNIDLQIAVTDNEKKPVEGVDITFFAIKNQFKKYAPPRLPDFSEEPKNRKLINNFSIDGNGLDNSVLQKNLNWQKWNALMTLDSISYFQLIYPESVFYLKTFEVEDPITQFAPYVIEEGELLPVHIIYMDGVPIYFSMTEHEQFYSFQARSGYHSIKLRTANKEVELDSVYFDFWKKSILGIDIGKPSNRYTVKKKPSILTNSEQQLARQYLTQVSNLNINKYVTQERRVFWTPQNKRRAVIGPLMPYAKANYVVKDQYRQSFKYEPRYHYKISEGLIKMTSLDNRTYSFPYNVTQGLNDEVLTEEKIELAIKLRNWNRQASYKYFDYPKESSEGKGAIAFWNPYPHELPVKNYILFKEQDPSFIRVYSGNESIFHDLDSDSYHAFALLFNNDYVERRSLEVKQNAALYLRLDSAKVQHSDSVSQFINEMILKEVTDVFYTSSSQYRDQSKIRSIYHSTRPGLELSGDMVRGRIVDSSTGEPLPGVTVLVKGTTHGTVTDLDGYYALAVPPGGELVYSFIGFSSHEMSIGGRSVIDVELEADMQALEEVVVVGYGVTAKRSLTGAVAGVSISGAPGASFKIRGNSSISGSGSPLMVIDGVVYEGDLDLTPDDIANMEVLKGDVATSLYGSRAVDGVILINLNKNSKAKKRIESKALDMGAFPDISQANPLRRNFSDYAFWKPKVETDKNGIAKINVTFPDDITTWDTYFLAVKDNKSTGIAKAEIRSFKPIMATFSTPRFLVESDSSMVLGRILNYTNDSLQLKSTFIFNESNFTNNLNVSSSHIDSLMVSTNEQDSIEVKYSIVTSSGYEDGELREIPVYKKGVMESKGFFSVLNSNEELTLNTDSLQGEFTFYAKGNLLPVLLDELKHIQNYPYGCNEQKASKLLALLYEKRIRKSLKEEFEGDRDIKKLIRQLQNSVNDKNTWGWWPDGSTVNWITRHVLHALYEAKKEGYEIEYNSERVKNELIAELHSPDRSDLSKISLLQKMEAKIDYATFLERLDSLDLNFDDRLTLIDLKQKAGFKSISLDSIMNKANRTMLGGMYWTNNRYSVYRNSILTTLQVYRILNEEGGYDDEKQAIINYLLSKKRSGFWRNTYESIKVLEAILPEVMEDSSKGTGSTLNISGDHSYEVNTFPFTQNLTLSNQLTFTNSGTGPIFITAYQTFFNPNPERVEKDFTVSTSFSTESLEKGEETTFTAEIVNTEEGEYVMVEIPIPAGTTYASKPRARGAEVHREYFRNRLAVFYEYLPSGTHEVEISLLPRFSGSYTINPAKAELMYFPTFYGREGMKKAVIE